MSDQQTKSASTIAEFCQRWGVGRSTFYDWLVSGHAPRTIKIGPKLRVITAEDEAAWLAAREAEAAQ